MTDYLQLTTRGKAQRLRKMVFKALDDFDLNVAKVSLISNEQNGIFRIDTHDKHKYILRVCLPDACHTIEEINSEMMLLNAIRQDSDINAPIPLKTKSGEWLTTVEVDGVPQPRHCVIFSWVSGVDLADRRSPETWVKFGALSAKLHQFGQRYTPPDTFQIPTYDTVFPFSGEKCVLFDEGNRQHFTSEQLDLIRPSLDRVQADIDQLYTDKTDLQITHGDLHHWNVRISRGKLSPIDFEDLFWAYPIQDISTTLCYNRFDKRYDALYASFKQGYEAILPFPEQYEGQLEIHMLARRFNLLNYIFSSEEETITDYPRFVPTIIEHIQWIQEHVWDK
jgi:Ser/Thr protein kinase RdoA (MazF antagonist)